MDKYNRMMHLNEHIRDQFKKQLKEIRNSNFKNKKKSFKRLKISCKIFKKIR